MHDDTMEGEGPAGEGMEGESMEGEAMGGETIGGSVEAVGGDFGVTADDPPEAAGRPDPDEEAPLVDGGPTADRTGPEATE